MKRTLLVAAICLFWTSFASAQSAVVKRNVNLRAEASTSSDILESFKPGTALTLIESGKTSGFYHVTGPDGQTGWVWSRNVSVSPSTSPTGATPTAVMPTTPATSPVPLFTMLLNARKMPVPEPLVLNGIQVCGPTGNAHNATAIALNTNKNRTDIPADSD
jgi:hypothetical protein